jgi:parallel beta-helix repeat protein
MYTVTDDINSSIVVEKNSIAIDGLGHLIQGNAESWQTAEGIGIDLTGRENVSVTNMIVMSFYTGISLHFSNGNSLSNITLGNNFYSMYIVGSSYNVINNNTVVSGNCGIYFFFDHDSFQVNFNNVLIGNYIFGCDSYGVRLVTCSSTFMRANTMSSSNCVFGVEGWDFEHYFNDIDSSNTVNGRPVYFWVNKSNRSVPTDAGYVALVNSTNVLVKDLNIHNVLQAVVLAYTDGSTVENVTASGCQEGIHLEVSQNNTISSNDISFSGYGIRFSERGGSSNNIVIGNRFSCDADGILLWGGTNNTLSDNSVINAYEFGISCFYADGNNVYHNTFISKGQAAYYYKPGANTWNNGYPSGGNYWSDYVGTDVFCGPSQNETGCDGVGDNPYVIDENNQDNYPLMGPWTKEGENITVTHASGICLVYADVTSNGITTVNETQQGPQVPLGFKLASEPPAYYDVRTTANYSGKITIAISYDDTNLTQEEENGLQLLHWNQTSQQWENITTYVNTQENVIYGETSHLSTFAIIAPLIHDVAVTRMIQSKTILCEGFTMRFNVTLANHGDFEEVFNVTVYANTAIIATFTNVTLASKNSTNLNISWNATGFARGNFTIWAYALPVPGETHTTDNDCTSGIVAVVMIGDIDADGKVDIKDVYKVALTYGTSLEGPNPPGRTYEPNCDINGDDKIDVKDYYIVCKHYGEFEP